MIPSPRIAFVHDAFSSYRQPLFRTLAENGRVHFFFLNESVGQLPNPSTSVYGMRIPMASDYIIAPALYASLLAAHRATPFDAVLCPEPSLFSAHIAWLAARRLGLPHIVWSGEWYTARHPRRWLMRPLERAIIRSASVCLAYSTRTARRLERYGARPERIHVIGNASDYAYTAPPVNMMEKARMDWAVGNRPIILFLGRLMAFKAPDVLMEAVAQLRNLDPFLLIAGSGPMASGLRTQATRLGVRNFRITGEEVRGSASKDLLYGLATVFVLPSRRARIAEPWGLVVNEAASASLPIVVSDHVGAAGDLIRDGESGLVVSEGNPASLASGIRRMLEAPDAARTMGIQARTAAAAFTIERMADGFWQAFNKAAGTRP
jgi:glycosyltransferase involved in cell wall biosynthesis